MADLAPQNRTTGPKTKSPRGNGPERPVARHYSYGEVAWILLAFVVCGVLFDSAGLVTWANRLKIGPAQAFWLRVLTPVHDTLARANLDAPRETLIATSDALTARYATGVEDAPRVDPDAPFPTASPQPLARLVDGPIARLPLPRGDEVELASLEALEPARVADGGPSGPTEVTILLVGDSMMQIGLAPGIAKAFAEDPHVRILRETKPGTGLSRPDVFDWPAELAPTLVHEKPRFVVASFGGNDAQDMRLSGQAIPFGTSSWDQTYADRVRHFMQELTEDGAEVLWVGLPPMRASDFNERVAKLNDIDVGAAKGVRHVEFLDPAPLVTGPDHAFTSYLPAPGGGLVQVRQEDGIHLSSAGGELVAQQAVAWIRARAISAGAAALSEPARSAPAADPRPGG